jgi:DNA-binding CsgD family transcriptional regulator
MSAAKTLGAILTAAEERVLTLVSQSMTNREIASSLGISPATVKRHLENILRKLQVRNRVEAAIYSLSMAGCPARNRSECPLELWRKGRVASEIKWAD